MTAPRTLFSAMGAHHSAMPTTEEWLTPPFVLDALGGWESFDLDPCTPAVQPWPTARARFTAADNGLNRLWHGRVWLNPPYRSHIIVKWLARMAEHDQGVALIFARTETSAFFRFVWDASTAVLFLKGRLNFHKLDGTRARANAGAPSVLCAYGAEDCERLAACGLDGQFVALRLPRFVLLAAIDAPWREIVASAVMARRGPVKLDELYSELACHPRTARNRHWRAKIRQTLQSGRYRRVGRGQWEAA